MTEEKKNRLSALNDLGEKRYRDKVVEEVGNEMSPEDELAIHRKAIALLFDIISTFHRDKIDNAEFAEYNDFIEGIKEKYKPLK